MNLKSFVIAASLALAVSSAAAAPSRAQDLPFSFGFQTPDGFGISIGNGGIGIQLPGMGEQHRQRHEQRCWSNREVVAFLRHSGFRNVELQGRDRRTVVAVADYDRAPYYVAVDPCRGSIVDTAHAGRQGRGGGWTSTGW